MNFNIFFLSAGICFSIFQILLPWQPNFVNFWAEEITQPEKFVNSKVCCWKREAQMTEDISYDKYPIIQLMTSFSGSQKQRLHFGKQSLTFARKKLLLLQPGFQILNLNVTFNWTFPSIDRKNGLSEEKRASLWKKLGDTILRILSCLGA